MIWLVGIVLCVGVGWLFGQGDVTVHPGIARASAPADGLTLLLGVTLGFYGRDRVRLRRTYASPSASYAAKAIFFASLAAAATWVCSPVSWPPSCLHVFAATGAAGSAIWLGNLPPKL